MRFFLEGVGLRGPGLAGWRASLPVLAGAQVYERADILVPPCDLLPANERRRAAPVVKLALAVGSEACAAAGRQPAALEAVFTSSGGDGDTIHEILNMLASPVPALSPTRFHNSVHNAPAGYWSIATAAASGSTSLCCHDDSFTAGLLEAAVQVHTRQADVVLIAYDVQYPFPLRAVRPIEAAFGVGLVLSAAPSPASLASVDWTLGPRNSVDAALPQALAALADRIPAARCLPLLAALARGQPACVTLGYLDSLVLTMDVTPVAR